MRCSLELQFHDQARGHEAEVLWRRPLPNLFATARAAAAAGKATIARMSNPAVVSYRIVDESGQVLDDQGRIIGRKNAA